MGENVLVDTKVSGFIPWIFKNPGDFVFLLKSDPANGKVLYPSCLPETDWIQREESPVIGRNMEVIRGLILARNFRKTIDNFRKYVIILA